MSKRGRIRIRAVHPQGRQLRGQDVIIELLDPETGEAMSFPCRSAQLVITADGRKEAVTARLLVNVAELDIEIDAEIDR